MSADPEADLDAMLDAIHTDAMQAILNPNHPAPGPRVVMWLIEKLRAERRLGLIRHVETPPGQKHTCRELGCEGL